MLNINKGNLVHAYKFNQWKGAMMVRYNIEGLFVALQTVLFQYYISIFNTDLTLARKDIVKIINAEDNK